MRIDCQQTILMKYHTFFVIFEKARQNFKLSSAANYRWRFMGQTYQNMFWNNVKIMK